MRKSIISIALLLFVAMFAGVPLSIIDSSYMSFDSGFSGPTWQATVRGDNSADYLVFGEKNDFETTINGQKATPASDFTLKMSVEEEKCEYNLLNTERNDIYQYQIDKIANDVAWWRFDDFKEECLNQPGGVVAWGTQVIAVDVYCLKETPIAKVGAIEEGKINFRTDFELQKDDEEPIEKSVGSLAQDSEDVKSSVSFTDGHNTVAKVRWIGGSTYGEFCPGQDNYVAIESDNRWYTADKDKFLLYNDQYKQLNELIDKTIETESTTEDDRDDYHRLVAAVNSRGTEALSQKPITAEGNTASFSGSKAIIELSRDHLMYAPDFQILINANWLGIVYESSKPKIINAGFISCTEKEGKTNNFYVTVENVGNNRGLFDIEAACQSGISLSTTKRSISLDPSETGTVKIPFSLDLNADSKKSCTIIVKDSNSDNEDRESISTTCQASTICSIEGRTACFGEVEKQCINGQWVETGSDVCLTSICNRNGVCESSEGESFEACGGKFSPENDCATCNLNGRCDATETKYSCPGDCGEVKPPIPTWAYIVGGAVLAGAVFFGFANIKPSKNNKSKKRRKK